MKKWQHHSANFRKIYSCRQSPIHYFLSNMKKTPDNKVIQQLGLSEMEYSLYLKLLQLGPTTITNLANKRKIARTTAFENIERLIKRGLIGQTIRGKRRLINAEKPEVITNILKDKQTSVQMKLNEIQQTIEHVPTFIKSIYKLIPKQQQEAGLMVNFFEDKVGIRKAYREVLQSDATYSFVDIENFFQGFPGFVALFEEAINNRPKMIMYDLLLDSPQARRLLKKSHERYLCKVITENFENLQFDFIANSKAIVIIQGQVENTSALMVRSPIIAGGFIALHQTIWKMVDKLGSNASML